MKAHILLLAIALAAPQLIAQVATLPDAPPVKDVTPDEAQKLLREKKDVTVIDLRTPDEFKEGHIAGAKNIDFMDKDFAQKIAALDKTKTYVVHCGSGRRSTSSLDAFKKEKFQSILHLNEGFRAWVAAGKPVEK